MSRTVLITRTLGDDKELRELLQTSGHRVIHEPLTEIFLNHTTRQELNHSILSEPDAVIVTSRYGVRALAALDDMRDIVLLCVGEMTAQVAESIGFTRVSVAGKTAEELTDYILDAYENDACFIYASAAHIRVDLTQILGHYGMRVKRIITYEAIASEQLSDTLVEQLKRGQLDAVTLLSKRSAEIFMALLEKANVKDLAQGLDYYCMSEMIAESLRCCGFQRIIISREPTLASLVQSVDNQVV